MKKITLSFLSALLVSTSAFAGGDIEPVVEPVSVLPTVEEASKYAVGLKLGTLGLGLDVSRAITDKLNLRVNINGASYSDTQCESDIEYDYDLTLASVGLLLDYYPMNNEFRVSAGAYYNANEFELSAQAANGFITVNGTPYNATNYRIDGMVDFDELAPYIGIGWGNSTKQSGWSFSVDLGVMYHGEPNVDLTPICLNGAACDAFTTSVTNEEAELINELNDYKLYPVFSVGVTYTF